VPIGASFISNYLPAATQARGIEGVLADQTQVVYTDTLQAIDQLVGTSTAPPPTTIRRR
jgi:hypothetical protein